MTLGMASVGGVEHVNTYSKVVRHKAIPGMALTTTLGMVLGNNNGMTVAVVFRRTVGITPY